MSTPSPAEVLAALDFPTPCTAPVPCDRPASTICRLTHLDAWSPCAGRPLCEVHAETWRAWLGVRASGGVVCRQHDRPVVWRWEPL